LIVAISARSESGDDYLYCLSGNNEEIIKELQKCYDLAYWYTWQVESLAKSETEAVAVLKIMIREAVDKAQDDE
jgi:hypothetical protein